MENMLNLQVVTKEKNRSRMYKLIILAITIGGFIFAGTWNSSSKADVKTNSVKNQYSWVNDTSDNDLERRRRGKGQRGRRRGGGGLR